MSHIMRSHRALWQSVMVAAIIPARERAAVEALLAEVAALKRHKGRASYFIPSRGLAPGVYMRKKTGDIPVRVLKLSDKVPNYKPSFDFISTALPAYREAIGPAFERALAAAIKSAR